MVYEWRLVVYPSGGIKTFEVGADVSAVIVLMKEIRCAILQEGDVLVKERTPKRSIFRYRFDNPTPSSYSILIETPSRKIQGKAKVSDSESGLRLSSDEDSSHTKYELIYTSRGIDSGKYKSRWEWHIDHPELTKPVLIDLEYTVGNNTLNGTIELDIFPEEDKITGTLTSMHLTNASIETQVSITSQVINDAMICHHQFITFIHTVPTFEIIISIMLCLYFLGIENKSETDLHSSQCSRSGCI